MSMSNIEVPSKKVLSVLALPRAAGEFAFDHFCDQANPAVIVARTCHLVNTMALTFRLELGGKDQWY
jgi:hypothetical protein